MRDALGGGLDVSVEQHRRRPETRAVRGRDPLDPAVDLEVAGSDERAHALTQDLDPGARHGVDARLAQRGERVIEPHAAAVGEVSRILRAERMEMDAGGRCLRGARDVEIALGIAGHETLHAQLRRAEVPRVGRDRPDVVEVERRAEARRGEVAVHDDRHGLADGVAPHVVGGRGEGVEVGSRRLEQGDPLGVVEGEGIFGRGLREPTCARAACRTPQQSRLMFRFSSLCADPSGI